MEIANAESVSERMADFLVIFFERLERQGVAGNWQGQYGETSLGIIWALPGYCRFYQNIDPEGLITLGVSCEDGGWSASQRKSIKPKLARQRIDSCSWLQKHVLLPFAAGRQSKSECHGCRRMRRPGHVFLY